MDRTTESADRQKQLFPCKDCADQGYLVCGVCGGAGGILTSNSWSPALEVAAKAHQASWPTCPHCQGRGEVPCIGCQRRPNND